MIAVEGFLAAQLYRAGYPVRDGVCATHGVYPGGQGGCPRCGAGQVRDQTGTTRVVDRPTQPVADRPRRAGWSLW